MMNVRVISDAGELGSITDAWQCLWEAHPRRDVFGHPQWAAAFLDAYGKGEGVHCLVFERGTEVCGILPLFRDARGVLKFIGDPRSDYSDMLCRPEDANEVAAGIAAHLRKLRSVELHAVPETSLLAGGLRALRGQPFRIEIEEPCPAIEFDAEGRLAAELVKKESLRRHEKKVAKLGAIRLHKITTQSEAIECLPVLFEQHIARWKTTGSPSLFLKEENRAFYHRLVSSEALFPMIDFRLLHAGERIVATHFGFFHFGRFLWYKPSYDPELSSIGPGEVLLKHLISAAAAEGATEFDFTRGNEGFKQRFATVTRQNLVIHRPSIVRRARTTASKLRARFLAAVSS